MSSIFKNIHSDSVALKQYRHTAISLKWLYGEVQSNAFP